MFRPRKAVLLFSVLAASHLASGAEFKPGEVIVKYKEGILRARSDVNSLYTSVGVKTVRRYFGLMHGYEHLILEENVDVQNALDALRRDSTVSYAQPNYILHALPIAVAQNLDDESLVKADNVRANDECWISGIPFPPGCSDSSSSPGARPGDSSGKRPALKGAPVEMTPPVADPDVDKSYGVTKIGAVEAWRQNYRGSKDFIVADIDTGIDYNHEDLSFNMWRNPNPDPTQQDVVGFDFVHNDGLPFDDNEHGTHTGGTIAAVGGNGVGTSGVIQKVSLMSVKFLSGQGDGTTADAIRAIDYAIQHGARVLSNSWGGPGDTDNQALRDAVERARAKNVLFVAAAGNDGSDNDETPSYPAAFSSDNVVSVAATDSSDRIASFSNFGKKTVHLAAPGVGVYSTLPGNKYGKLSGTSMACPHVAGALALLWSQRPKLTYKEVKELLLKNVDRLPVLEGKTVTGGRLNILNALRASATGSDSSLISTGDRLTPE